MRTILAGPWRRLDLPGLLPDELVAVQHGPAPCDDRALVRWLRAGCPAPSPVRQGFVAVRCDPRGEVVGVSGFRRELPLLYAVDHGRLVLGSHPSDVIGAMSRAPDLDSTKLADLLALYDCPDRTVYRGVSRVPRGQLLRHRPGERTVTVSTWFERDHAAPPDPRAAPDLVRRTVTEAVAASLPVTGEVTATLSGGLDSAFVVAIAAGLLQPGRSVHCATHVPLPGTADPSPNWDADDGPVASLVAQAVPGVTHRQLANTDLMSPLEAVQAAFGRTWAPFRNVANRVWLNQMQEWADSRGSPLLLTGVSGNPAYSRNRGGLLEEMVRHGQVVGVARQLRVRRAAGDSTRRVLRGAVGELRGGRLRGRLGGGWASTLVVRHELLSDDARAHLQRFSSKRSIDSRDWDALLLDDTSVQLPCRPGTGAWWSDPFSDEHVARLALRLPAEAWMAGGRDRGLAREAARGLVPDAVRLRTRRGSQAADVGLWTRGREQHYREVLEEVLGDETFHELVDDQRLRTLHDRVWQSSGSAGSAGHSLERMSLDRALGMGLFVRWWKGGHAALGTGPS